MSQQTQAPTEADLIAQAKSSRKATTDSLYISAGMTCLAVVSFVAVSLIQGLAPSLLTNPNTIYMPYVFVGAAILMAGMSIYFRICATDFTIQAIYHLLRETSQADADATVDKEEAATKPVIVL